MKYSTWSVIYFSVLSAIAIFNMIASAKSHSTALFSTCIQTVGLLLILAIVLNENVIMKYKK